VSVIFCFALSFRAGWTEKLMEHEIEVREGTNSQKGSVAQKVGETLLYTIR